MMWRSEAFTAIQSKNETRPGPQLGKKVSRAVEFRIQEAAKEMGMSENVIAHELLLEVIGDPGQFQGLLQVSEPFRLIIADDFFLGWTPSHEILPGVQELEQVEKLQHLPNGFVLDPPRALIRRSSRRSQSSRDPWPRRWRRRTACTAPWPAPW